MHPPPFLHCDMKSIDILYYSLSIGFLVLVASVAYASFRFAQAIGSMKKVLDDVEDTTRDIRYAKNRVLSGIKYFVRMLFHTGGEKDRD